MNLDDVIANVVAEKVAPLLVERLLDGLADPLLSPKQAAAWLSISRNTLHSLNLPKVWPTPSTPRYRLSTLRKHIQHPSNNRRNP